MSRISGAAGIPTGRPLAAQRPQPPPFAHIRSLARVMAWNNGVMDMDVDDAEPDESSEAARMAKGIRRRSAKHSKHGRASQYFRLPLRHNDPQQHPHRPANHIYPGIERRARIQGSLTLEQTFIFFPFSIVVSIVESLGDHCRPHSYEQQDRVARVIGPLGGGVAVCKVDWSNEVKIGELRGCTPTPRVLLSKRVSPPGSAALLMVSLAGTNTLGPVHLAD